jgi:hypothetical protein
MSKPLVLQIFLHGTDDASTILNGKGVTEIDAGYFTSDFKRSFANTYQNQGYNVLQQNFSWNKSNGPLHQPEDRKTVSNKLTSELRATLQKLKDQGKLPKDMRIALIGHSHGGNVAINGLRHLKDTAAMFGVNLTVDLYTINTPTYTDKVGADYKTVSQGGNVAYVPTKYVMNYEDPRRYINQANLGNNVQVNHFHAGVKDDAVTFAASGGNSYGENGVTYSKTYNNDNLGGFKEHYAIPQMLNSRQSKDYLNNEVPSFLQNHPMSITQAQANAKVNKVRLG